jgi:electron transport complex protein RnfE
MDALGVGVGYLLSLVLISFIREVLSAGTLWGYRLTPMAWGGRTILPEYQPANVMAMAPGAFILLGLLFGFFAWRGNRKREASRRAAVPAVAQVARDFPKPPKDPKPAEGTAQT